MSGERVPIGAEARGKLRVYKRSALARYEQIMCVYNSDAFKAAAGDFRWKKGKGRSRALAKLRALLRKARFEQTRLEYPVHALWAVLKPPGSVIDQDDPEAGPGKLQACVTVDYIVVGELYRVNGRVFDGHSTGFWAIEFPDHAIGRLIQRDPTANIDAVLWQAHRAVLAIRLIGLDRSGAGLRIPAGNGVFVAELLKGHDLDTGDDQMFHIQARTWLHGDQLPDKQIPTAVSEIVGERLGDNLLLPLPLRHTYAVSAEVMAMVRRAS